MIKSLRTILSVFFATILFSAFGQSVQVGIGARVWTNKHQPIIYFDYKGSNSIRFGAYGSFGKLGRHHQLPVRGLSMPHNYGPFYLLTKFLESRSSFSGWSIGIYAENAIRTGWPEQHQFLVRLDGQYLSLRNNYTDRVRISRASGVTDETFTDIFRFGAVSGGLRFGYKRQFRTFYAQVLAGPTFYHPLYSSLPYGNSGYSTEMLFVGVEYELDIGIGYYISNRNG